MHGTKMDDVATVYLLKLLQTTISTLLEPTALSLQQTTNVSPTYHHHYDYIQNHYHNLHDQLISNLYHHFHQHHHHRISIITLIIICR